MKLVVGLGNPGAEYAETRHNAGFRILERVAARHRIELRSQRALRAHAGSGRIGPVDVTLLLPQTFMNRSGRSVLRALDALGADALAREGAVEPAEDLLVVYDDLDLPFGRLRLRPGGGAGGHNGIGDIQDRLRRNDFPRLRFGIGRPPPGEDPVEYVLRPFSTDERGALPGLVDTAADAVEAVVIDGVESAMNRFNSAKA